MKLGDPNRIILFGQSAGGYSVDSYAYAHADQKDPIVKGIIAQSGSASANRGGMVRDGGNTAAWKKVASALACPGEGKASLDCVRSKPWLDVLNAVRGGPNLSGGAMRCVQRLLTSCDIFNQFAVRLAHPLIMKSFLGTTMPGKRMASSSK
jgi:carboxylesterase type B